MIQIQMFESKRSYLHQVMRTFSEEVCHIELTETKRMEDRGLRWGTGLQQARVGERFMSPAPLPRNQNHALKCPIIFRRSRSILSGFQESHKPQERYSQRKKRKNIMKALKMSVIHVIFFILSWTPYTAMATWQVHFATISFNSKHLFQGHY